MKSAQLRAAVSQTPVVKLGRYRLLLEIDQGGMARVFVASYAGLGGFNKLVALKVMRDEFRESEETVEMFLAEARLAARMNHPNVVQTLEVGEEHGRYYTSMEYLEGRTLGALMKSAKEKPVPLAMRLEVVCQVLDGLAYMHTLANTDGTPLHLVHRDISPTNVFVTFEGTTKVLDFGIAKAIGVSHVTEAGVFKGKLGYAAPEQILGNSEQRSDIFAVGVLLWELLATRRFTQGRTQQEVIQARMAGVESELLNTELDAPEGFMQICLRATAKEPADRYPSATAMRDDIRACMLRNKLEITSEKIRELLSSHYSAEREEVRRLIEIRLKQSRQGDELTAAGPTQLLVAPLLNGSNAGGGTLTGSASQYSLAPAPHRMRWGVAIVSVATLAGALGYGLRPRSTPQDLATSSAAGQATKPTVTAGSTHGQFVTLRVAVSPNSAQVLLDGAKLDGNPFVGVLPKDSALHRLELRGEGLNTQARMISLDHDQDFTFDLEPADSAPAHKPGLSDTEPSSGKPLKSGSSGTQISANPSTASRKPRADSTRSSEDSDVSTATSLSHKPRSGSARPIDDSDPYAR